MTETFFRHETYRLSHSSNLTQTLDLYWSHCSTVVPKCHCFPAGLCLCVFPRLWVRINIHANFIGFPKYFRLLISLHFWNFTHSWLVCTSSIKSPTPVDPLLSITLRFFNVFLLFRYSYCGDLSFRTTFLVLVELIGWSSRLTILIDCHLFSDLWSSNLCILLLCWLFISIRRIWVSWLLN